MAKLIGTNPNQVPTNADLGDMAYQNGRNLAKIKAQQVEVESGAAQSDLYLRTNDDTHYDWRWTNEGNVNRLRLLGAKDGLTSVFPMYVNGDAGGAITMPAQPTFAAYIQTRTNWAATGLQKLPFDNTLINQGSHFNTSNNRFTAPTSGRYQFNLSLNCIGDIRVYIYKNGSAYHAGEYRSNPTNIWEHAVIEAIVNLSANDYVEAYVNLTGTGFAWNGGSSLWDQFSGHLIN